MVQQQNRSAQFAAVPHNKQDCPTTNGKYVTFPNKFTPTDTADLMLVFIKVFLILFTLVLLGLDVLHWMLKKFKKLDDDLSKAIKEINKILFKTVIVIYFIIAIIALVNFREYWRVAAEKGRDKMNDMIHDVKKVTNYRSCPKNPSTQRLKSFTSGVSNFATKLDSKVHVSHYVNSLTKSIDSIKDEEFMEYTKSLVWWNYLFLLPIYAGLWQYKGDSSLIEMFG